MNNKTSIDHAVQQKESLVRVQIFMMILCPQSPACPVWIPDVGRTSRCAG